MFGLKGTNSNNRFADSESAQNALELNGFKLGGRPIRVGLGNEKINIEPPESLIKRLGGGPGVEIPSSLSAASSGAMSMSMESRSLGGHARDDKKPTGALASALDDSEVNGVTLNSVSRESLMKKLMREEDALPVQEEITASRKPAAGVQPSRCIALSNMFDPAE